MGAVFFTSKLCSCHHVRLVLCQLYGYPLVRLNNSATDVHVVYSYDDDSGDTSLSSFNIDNAPSYLFSVLSDILSVNSRVRVHVLPWSPPGWMKSGGTMGWCQLKL